MGDKVNSKNGFLFPFVPSRNVLSLPMIPQILIGEPPNPRFFVVSYTIFCPADEIGTTAKKFQLENLASNNKWDGKKDGARKFMPLGQTLDIGFSGIGLVGISRGRGR